MKIIKLLFLLAYSFSFYAQNVGINASNAAPEASAMLDVSSTTKGVLFPRMNTLQRNSLTATAVTGLTVFDTDVPAYFFFDGSTWVEILSKISENWTRFSTNLYATSPFFSFIGGSITSSINAGAATDGTLRVFSPPASNIFSNYLNIDATSIQARYSHSLNGKAERPLRLNPFGGDIGIGLGTALPSAKLHLAGNMKIDGNNTLEFGADVLNKNINAGKIGYQTFGNADALDIVGAGPNNNRKISLYAEGGLSIFGGLKLPTKVVYSDYTPSEADFTILADMEGDINKTININLPTPSAGTNGRIYIVTSANLPNTYPIGAQSNGWVNVNNLTLNSLYNNSKLYYSYRSGIQPVTTNRFELIHSVTVQCIGSEWRIIAQSKDFWYD